MIDYMDTQLLAEKTHYYTHFFNKDSMRFFNSRLGQVAYIVRDNDGTEYAYFTTSEKGPNDKRAFTVRCMHMVPGKQHWSVASVGEFQAHTTGRSASKAMVTAAQDHEQRSGTKLDHGDWYKIHIELRDFNYSNQKA